MDLSIANVCRRSSRLFLLLTIVLISCDATRGYFATFERGNLTGNWLLVCFQEKPKAAYKEKLGYFYNSFKSLTQV